MLIKFGIPIFAALALGFGLATTVILKPEEQLTQAVNPPAHSTLAADTIAGLGELQTPGEQIAISAALPGVVKEVFITTGGVVRAGDSLFTLDDRELAAQLASAQRALDAAKARLERLRAGTRDEDLPPARARVASAQVMVDRNADFLERARALIASGALSREEFATRDFALRLAKSDLAEAQAQLARLEAGPWMPDLQVAQSEVNQAQAEVERIGVELQRLVVRAPLDATVLRCDVRVGEFIQPGDATRPPVLLGAAGPLQLRVQVDEEDASRVTPGAKAEAFVRGRERIRLDLEFVRIEPRVVPKTSLTGSTTERVDTRVLFVVYQVVGTPERVYPGQKLDVFITARR
ncbi:MAG TPA: HlyD family efflux transporter periplasmic adaptor subunit [Phycisphaerales bacterium]|nr:HlyD family efflux transporter periplasmic adaptor subunit [Phycisphaerales bacterium]